jgi:hypothetical protein
MSVAPSLHVEGTWHQSCPFTLDGAGSAGVIAIAVATAVLAYLLGATYVGAEWSTRSMVALLFWEPRRARVMAAKLTTLAVATALLAVLAEGTWLVTARMLAATRGTTTGPEGVWGATAVLIALGVVLFARRDLH